MVDRPIAVAGYYRDQQVFCAAVRAAVAEKRSPQPFTPYPVHGLDGILGLKRSLIGRPVFISILVGFVVMLALSWYMMDYSWPLNVGGKPYYDWRCYAIISLEIGLLLGTFTTFTLAAHYCRLMPEAVTQLPNPRMSDDTFTLVLPVADGAAPGELASWLQAHQAEETEIFTEVVAETLPVSGTLPPDAVPVAGAGPENAHA